MVLADEKSAIILEAARALFFSRGYDTTSMDLVARDARVSKATVYAHFKSKEQLLLKLVEAEVNRMPLMHHHSPPKNMVELKKALISMAEEFAKLFRDERTLALNRLVIAQAHSYPQIAEAFYEAAPLRVRREVEDILDGAVEAGLLSIKNKTRAAIHLLSLVAGDLPLRGLLSLPVGSTEMAHIEEGIDIFLAAHSA